jgi:exosortase
MSDAQNAADRALENRKTVTLPGSRTRYDARAVMPQVSTTSAPATFPAPATVRDALQRTMQWASQRPLDAILLAALLGGLVYFFAIMSVVPSGEVQKSIWGWAWAAWNTENDLEHGSLILPGAIVVAWMQRQQFAAAAKKSSWIGLLPVLIGVLFFFVATWTSQPRLALISLPFLIFGAVHFLWGWEVAKAALIPCALLFFMVPVGFLLHYTGPLQQLIAATSTGLANLVGVGVDREGIKLVARDGSFQCEVAGGCSGIRSLMAMTMLSLLYVHFNERGVWRKVLVFAMTLPFTVFGNMIRVFTIILASKWVGQDFGTGPWHDISGFIITIPIAVGLMIGFSDVLNRDWSAVKGRLLARDSAPYPDADDNPDASKPKKPASSGPISYDY